MNLRCRVPKTVVINSRDIAPHPFIGWQGKEDSVAHALVYRRWRPTNRKTVLASHLSFRLWLFVCCSFSQSSCPLILLSLPSFLYPCDRLWVFSCHHDVYCTCRKPFCANQETKFLRWFYNKDVWWKYMFWWRLVYSNSLTNEVW